MMMKLVIYWETFYNNFGLVDGDHFQLHTDIYIFSDRYTIANSILLMLTCTNSLGDYAFDVWIYQQIYPLSSHTLTCLFLLFILLCLT